MVNQIKYKKVVTLTFSETVTKCKKTEDVTTFKSTVKLYLLKMYCFASIFTTSQDRRGREKALFIILYHFQPLTNMETLNCSYATEISTL